MPDTGFMKSSAAPLPRSLSHVLCYNIPSGDANGCMSWCNCCQDLRPSIACGHLGMLKEEAHIVELDLQLLARRPAVGAAQVVEDRAHHVKVLLGLPLRPLGPLQRLVVQVCKGLVTVGLPPLLLWRLLGQCRTFVAPKKSSVSLYSKDQSTQAKF